MDNIIFIMKKAANPLCFTRWKKKKGNLTAGKPHKRAAVYGTASII